MDGGRRKERRGREDVEGVAWRCLPVERLSLEALGDVRLSDLDASAQRATRSRQP